jgi:hypothetical protein
VKKEKKSNDEDDELEIPNIPAVLDGSKSRIRQNMVKTKDPSYKLNLFPQLIGGQFEIEAKLKTKNSYREQREKAQEQTVE